MSAGPYDQSVVERFSAKVDRTDTNGCWLWTASLDSQGYGQLMVTHDGTKRPRKAHRLAWEIHHEVQLTADQCVLHHCDNPQCVRPDHLFVGTVHANNTDMTLKGRHANQVKTHCAQGHQFTGETVMTRGKPTRVCRVCRRESSKAYRARNAA